MSRPTHTRGCEQLSHSEYGAPACSARVRTLTATRWASIQPLSLSADLTIQIRNPIVKSTSRVVKNDFVLRISIVCLQRRWRRQKNPQRIAEDTSAVFSSSPPRFVKTLKMLTTELVFTTLLKVTSGTIRRECRENCLTNELFHAIFKLIINAYENYAFVAGLKIKIPISEPYYSVVAL